jgi:hypothetical protein
MMTLRHLIFSTIVILVVGKLYAQPESKDIVSGYWTQEDSAKFMISLEEAEKIIALNPDKAEEKLLHLLKQSQDLNFLEGNIHTLLALILNYTKKQDYVSAEKFIKRVEYLYIGSGLDSTILIKLLNYSGRVAHDQGYYERAASLYYRSLNI